MLVASYIFAETCCLEAMFVNTIAIGNNGMLIDIAYYISADTCFVVSVHFIAARIL